MRRAAALLAAAVCADAGVVHWMSEPVLPGQTALIAVIGIRNSSVVELRQPSQTGQWQRAAISGVTHSGCAVKIPGSFEPSVFDVRVDGDSTIHVANAPKPWFFFGDQGDSATPGGWLRIVGDTISIDPRKHVAVLTLKGAGGAGHDLVIPARNTSDGQGVGAKHTRWHAFFDIPGDVRPGSYTVVFSNGASAPRPVRFYLDTARWFVTRVNITAPPVWSNQTFSVLAFGSPPQPGPGRNHTAAVHAALQAAAAAGGGVVYFPRGQYFVAGPITVPPGTVIRGEGTSLVAIYFGEDSQKTAPKAYITNSGPGRWGVEDVTLYVTAYANNIVQFQPDSDGAFLRRTRIRFNSYFCLEPVQGKSSRGRTADWPHSVGTAVMLAGKNLHVTDNDIFSSGDVVSTLNNGAPGAEFMHIARNRLWNGGTTHWGVSWRQCIFEDNVATGTSTTAMGSNYPQYAHGNGEPHVQNIYHHNNSQNMVWGNDREMMTCDGGGGVYYGGIEPSTTTQIKLLKPAQGEQPGGAICILAGTGAGACRRVLGSDSSKTVWTVDQPFFGTDNSTVVTITPYVGNIAFNGNRYSDGGEVQFFAQALGCVAAENVFERTGGLSAWGRQEETAVAWGANLRLQFFDNDVAEGNHVWNYATHPTPSESPGAYPYFPGGSKTIEPWFFGSLTNDQGPPEEPGSRKGFQGALNRFVVFRGNSVQSNGGIVVRGTSANVLVEGSVVRQSDVGIHVNYTTTQGGVVLSDNDLPPAVPDNYNPYA